jgi:hypothetical protein
MFVGFKGYGLTKGTINFFGSGFRFFLKDLGGFQRVGVSQDWGFLLADTKMQWEYRVSKLIRLGKVFLRRMAQKSPFSGIGRIKSGQADLAFARL